MKPGYMGALVLALLSGAAGAEERGCYVLWEAQCFEIHDAEKRDITHHILMTDGPVELQVDAGSCNNEKELLQAQQRQALQAAFSERMADIDGCAPPDELNTRTSKRIEPLVERFERLQTPHERREVYILDPPQPGS